MNIYLPYSLLTRRLELMFSLNRLPYSFVYFFFKSLLTNINLFILKYLLNSFFKYFLTSIKKWINVLIFFYIFRTKVFNKLKEITEDLFMWYVNCKILIILFISKYNVWIWKFIWMNYLWSWKALHKKQLVE